MTFQPYNLTSVDAGNVLSLVQGVNQFMMFDMLGILLLLIFWFVSYISMNHFWPDTKLNFTASSFFVAIISMVFMVVDLVPDYLPFLTWSLFAIGLITMVFSR